MECSFCVRLQKDGFPGSEGLNCKGIEYVDECHRPGGKAQKLSGQNRKLLDLFGRMNIVGPEVVFKTYRVPIGQRPIILDRYIGLLSAIKRIREKSNDHKAKNRPARRR